MRAPTRGSSANRRNRWAERYGPWAVVTGASDGIGRELAICLARAGVHVVLTARREALLQELAADIVERYGVQARIVVADLARSSGVDSIRAATADLEVGLLAAAAGFGSSGPLLDSPTERELEMVALNCAAPLALTSHFACGMVARGRGGVILMSSIVAFQGTPGSANYAATKAYIQSLAEALHQELGPLGVDVLASAPGPVHSGFAARAGMRMGKALSPEQVAQPTLDALGRRSTVRPGWLSKFLSGSLALLPRWGRVRMMGQVMRGMTNRENGGEPKHEPGSA
jgi:short-subunit dehydrogenase